MEKSKYTRDSSRIDSAKKLVALLKREFLAVYPTNSLEIKALPKPQKAPNLPETLNLSRSAMAQIGMDTTVLSVLCGTLLGDGSIQKQAGYANARIQYRHSTRQTDWFMWKTLGPLSSFMGPEAIQFQSPDGFQKKAENIGGETLGKLKVASRALPEFTELTKVICESGAINIQRHWLNHMNAYFLMTLWLDDGGLVGGYQGLFSLNSTAKKELEVFVNYLNSVWGIESTINAISSNENQFRVVIKDQENLYKLMQIIAPLIPVKSMLYKVCFYPTDSNLLQRWTTEIKTLVCKEWHDEIDKQYLYKAILLSS